MATNAKLPPPPPPTTNGIHIAPARGLPGGNRKKQKRRAKQAAKAATDTSLPPAGRQLADLGYDEDPLGYDNEDDEDYSDGELEQYQDQYIPPHASTNGFAHPPPSASRRNAKKPRTSLVGHNAYNPDMLPPLPNPPPLPAGALRPMQMHRGDPMHRGDLSHGNVWNTSTTQERQNI